VLGFINYEMTPTTGGVAFD